MQFNISNCVHLPITNKTKPSSHQYSLFGHPLSKVASHAYLGVKLDSKLSWAKHITEITTKSSKVLGMVKRTLGPCKPEVKDTAYNMPWSVSQASGRVLWCWQSFLAIALFLQHSKLYFCENGLHRCVDTPRCLKVKLCYVFKLI